MIGILHPELPLSRRNSYHLTGANSSHLGMLQAVFLGWGGMDEICTSFVYSHIEGDPLLLFVFQSENIRWSHSIKSFEEQEITACGDILLTAAFVSYIGPFTKLYRQELVEHMWLPFLKLQKVSLSNFSASISCWHVF